MKFNSAEFFSVEPEKLIVGRILTFDLFIYLPLNERIVMIRKTGETIEQNSLDHFKTRGVKCFHIKTADNEAYLLYLDVTGEKANSETTLATGAGPEAPQAEAPKTNAPKANVAVASTPALPNTKVAEIPEPIVAKTVQEPTTEEKEFVPPTAAETVISGLLKPDPDKTKAMDQGREIVRKILENAPPEIKGIIENPATEHATTVAIYSALFAMGLGRKDQFVLQDLIISSLLHDIGVSQIPPEVLATPETKQSAPQKAQHQDHVARGIELLAELDYTPNTRVLQILSQHHERFDGQGYPNHVGSFKIEELAQVLCLSDLLDTISRGRYDGTVRTLPESIAVVSEIERQTSFPRYFNPDMLKKVRNWLTKGGGQDFMAAATTAVTETQEKLLKSAS